MPNPNSDAPAPALAIVEADRQDTPAGIEVETSHPTPEIERTYARWAKARGEMLIAYATDSPDPEAAKAVWAEAEEARSRVTAEAWAMVGQHATSPRHMRMKIEAFRDQYEPSGNRLDGLELALINSIDSDLAATG